MKPIVFYKMTDTRVEMSNKCVKMTGKYVGMADKRVEMTNKRQGMTGKCVEMVNRGVQMADKRVKVFSKQVQNKVRDSVVSKDNHHQVYNDVDRTILHYESIISDLKTQVAFMKRLLGVHEKMLVEARRFQETLREQSKGES